MRTAALFLLLTFATQTFAAPAPFRRAEKPPPTAQPQEGRWLMKWGGTLYEVEMWGDGCWRSRWLSEYGEPWFGTWSFDPRTRVLTVYESSLDGLCCHWSVTLDGSLSWRGGSLVRRELADFRQR